MIARTLIAPRRRHDRAPARARAGFTLVELLVVIGIIALLIAILLPTLRRARMAADNAACLSNLRQIGQATIMYRSETGRIPFFFILRNYPWQPVPPGGTGNAVWWTAFSHGGKTTHDTISVGYMDDVSKPLNKYLYKDVTPEPWLGAKIASGLRRERDVFRCPADTGEGMGRKVGVAVDYLAPGVGSPYQAYGTTYMSNRGFMHDRNIINLYYKVMTSPITHEKVNFFNNGISKIVMRWNATQTYVMADVWFLWSLFYHQAVPGMHSSESRHNAVFLDGHAEHAYISARDVQEWGPRNNFRYLPKTGSNWYEARNVDIKGATGGPQSPWGGGDPFGSGNNERQGVAN